MKIETDVNKVFLATKGQEAGEGVMAFVHTIVEDAVKLTAKVVKAKKDGKMYAFPPSSQGKDGKSYGNFGFKTRTDSDEWAEECLKVYHEKVGTKA